MFPVIICTVYELPKSVGDILCAAALRMSANRSVKYFVKEQHADNSLIKLFTVVFYVSFNNQQKVKSQFTH